MQTDRNEPERLSERSCRVYGDRSAEIAFLCRKQTCRKISFYRQIRTERQIAFQDLRGKQFRRLHRIDQKPLFRSPCVDGEAFVHVRCRCDHRIRADGGSNTDRQLVRPSDMARQKRDHVLTPFVSDDHGGIAGLGCDARRDCSHRDTAGSHEDQSVAFCKEFRRHTGQIAARLNVYGLMIRRQDFCDALRQFPAPV